MILRNALVVLVISCFSLPPARAQAAQQPDLTILFTGYLLGYYRVPEIQPADFQGVCPSAPDRDSLAEKLQKKIKIARDENPGSILVGMGDNFGVELYSRIYQDGSGPHPKPRNSLDPQWTSVPASQTIADNVGCFFSLAGYDALVPGKEDLHFGPERLRRIAQRLASANLHMLAANLVVQTSYVDEPTKIPDSAKGLKFTPGLPEVIAATAEISDHDGAVLPFLRKIAVRAAASTTPDGLPHLYLCAAPQGRPDEFSCNVPVDLKGPVPDKISISDEDTSGTQGATRDFKYLLPENFYLQAGGNYQLCAASKAGASKDAKPRCIRFSVAVPYFQSCALGDCQPNQYDSPYVFRPGRGGGKGVVIYGVVDPDVELLVGRDNLSWKNVHSSLKSELATLEPMKSLQQAEQLFEKDHPGERPRKVLLAQMSRAKAEELAENLDFDLVIASARPYEHATTNRKLTLYPTTGVNAKTPEVDRPNYRGVVVIPWEGTKSTLDCPDSPCPDTTLFNPLRQLDLRDYGVSAAGGERRELNLCGDRLAVNHDETWRPKRDLNAAAGARLNWKASATDAPVEFTAADAFVNLTLKTLREKTHADLALMQKRDFYAGPFRPPSSNASDATKNALGIERVLWTGDILQVVTVSGDTLKKVLKESDLFDQQDIQATEEKVQTGRGFYTFSITKTQDEQYVIDGDLLDPKRLYTVATTNHVTAGDTGYPELNDPQLANKQLPKPSGVEGIRISELVCDEMVHSGCVKELTTRYPKGGGNLLFASRTDGPSETKSGPGVRARAWFIHALDQPMFPNTPPDDPEKLELDAQNRRAWRFSLLEASVSFAWSSNNLSEARRAKLLTGFTEPGLEGANSHSWQSTTRAELVGSGKFLDEYLRSQSDYSSQVQEQSPPQFASVSRPSNRYQFDAGFFYHPFTICHYALPCLTARKQYPKAGFVIEPFRFDSPLAQEELIIGPPPSTEQKVNLGRAQRFLMRGGIRLENAKSHFEAGFEGGWERGALNEIVTSAGTCFPMPKESPEYCLSQQTPPIANIDQVRETRDRRGFYIDWAWTTALMHGWKYIVQNQAEWFPFDASGDNSSDTRYRYDLTNKFSIPLLKSLSFQPGVEYFRYRNEFGTTYLARWSPSASLSWSFDVYSGGKLGKELSYKPGGDDSEK